MDIQLFNQLVDNSKVPSDSEIAGLKNIVDEYPYFQIGIFTYLKSLFLYNNDEYKSELTRLAIFVNDRKALFYYILSEEYDQFFTHTGKKEISEDKTSILLNAFFDTLDNNDDDPEFEYNLINSSLASTDYFTYLEIQPKENIQKEPEKEAIPLKHQVIIDSFIERSKEDGGIKIHIDKEGINAPITAESKEVDTDDELSDDMFFTETLAKIYIKQRKYEKAYKIIKHLSLNYPKKNIYFADQLSFLEKLIINSKFKDKK